jgi:hypothetical protein
MDFRNRICEQEFLTSLRTPQPEVFTGNFSGSFRKSRFPTAFSIRDYLARYLHSPMTIVAISRKCFTLRDFGATRLKSR